MTITINMNFATVAEMHKELEALLGGSQTNRAPVQALTHDDRELILEASKAALEARKPPKPKASKPVATPAAPAPEETTAQTAEATPASESPSEPAAAAQAAPSITLEEVRAKLAALSQSGKGPQVKGLIAAIGVEKLTDVPAEKYPELLEKAAAL